MDQKSLLIVFDGDENLDLGIDISGGVGDDRRGLLNSRHMQGDALAGCDIGGGGGGDGGGEEEKEGA